jgi:hypothetical protein
MSTKQVTHARRDKDGDITHLGSTSPYWVTDARTIISEIEGWRNSYVVAVAGRWVKVIVKQGTYRKYLATEADGYGKNNLDNLPSI